MDNRAFETSKKPKRDWWQKGRALDMWSIPHFLFGVLTAILAALLNLSFIAMLALTTGIATLWEIGEYFFDIEETFLNRMFDIILPIVACILTINILLAYTLYRDDLIVIGIAVSIIYAYTNISGWLAYRRRHRDFIY